MSESGMSNDQFVNHEVRIQIVEKAIVEMKNQFVKIDDEFKQLRKENHNHFVTMVGLMITLFGATILTKFLG